tara:strand:+ start:89 stop:382 length:294 start_codon:yes stop_codon:yes gene_type:complete
LLVGQYLIPARKYSNVKTANSTICTDIERILDGTTFLVISVALLLANWVPVKLDKINIILIQAITGPKALNMDFNADSQLNFLIPILFKINDDAFKI